MWQLSDGVRSQCSMSLPHQGCSGTGENTVGPSASAGASPAPWAGAVAPLSVVVVASVGPSLDLDFLCAHLLHLLVLLVPTCVLLCPPLLRTFAVTPHAVSDRRAHGSGGSGWGCS